MSEYTVKFFVEVEVPLIANDADDASDNASEILENALKDFNSDEVKISDWFETDILKRSEEFFD